MNAIKSSSKPIASGDDFTEIATLDKCQSESLSNKSTFVICFDTFNFN